MALLCVGYRSKTHVWQGFYDYLQNCDDVVQCQPFAHGGTSMPRLAQDVIVISQPVRTYPNGDIFFVELSRKHNRYNCLLKMARDGNTAKSVIVVRAQGKTIREAEDDCYRKALERCPRFPRPPYLKRGSKSARVVTEFLAECFEKTVKA
jgi:hypothetical protein